MEDIKLNFGQYEGYRISEIAEINRSYLAFLATIPSFGRPHLKEVVSQAINLTTLEERNKVRKSKRYNRQKINDTQWLIDFCKVKAVTHENPKTQIFCKTLCGQLRLDHRIDNVSFKQLKILIELWGIDRGEKYSPKYWKAKKEFISHLEGKWSRKNETLKDLL